MLRKFSLIILVLFAVTLIGCDDDAAAPSVAISEVESTYYDLFCDKIQTCDVFNAYVDIAISTHEQCLDFVAYNIQNEGGGLGSVIDAVNEGTVLYDGAKAYACVEAMAALPCDEFGDAEPEACNGVFTGTIADGSACFINEECESGYCDTDAECPGTCMAAVLEGDGCETTDECETGAKCVLGECTFFTASVTEGGACDPDEDWCADGLFCHPDTEECTGRLSAGEDCDGMADLECESGTMCIGMGGTQATCVELTIMESVDDVCSYNDGDICAMYNDLVCALDDFQNFTGTCQISAKLDDMCFDSENLVLTSCDMWGDLYCDMPGGWTEDGFCTAKKDGGEACDDDDQCLSGWCNVDVCEAVEEICE